MKTWKEMSKDARIDAIIEAWKIAPSAQGMASLIPGATRNAIIGTYHRNKGLALKYPLGNYRIPHPKSDPNRQQAPKKYHTGPKKPSTDAPDKPKAQSVIQVAPVSLDFKLEDLNRGDCKWPTREGPWRFCGHNTHKESSWCEFHYKKAFQPRSS